MRVGLRHANASRVTPVLWIGGDLEIRNLSLARIQLEELSQTGITSIVDLRLEWDDKDWVTDVTPHINYLSLGVDDAGQKMPDDWFDIGTTHVLAAIHRGGAVLVHCHMGINRGPSMGFAVMLALGWDPIEALDRIRDQRPIAYVGYAEDALDWWLRKNGATKAQRAAGYLRVLQWRQENDLDVVEVIRGIRSQERA